MGATSLGYPTFFALKLFGNLLGPKILQPISCFQESCFTTEWQAPNLQTLDTFHGKAQWPNWWNFVLNRTSWSPIIRIPSRSWGSPAMGFPWSPTGITRAPWGPLGGSEVRNLVGMALGIAFVSEVPLPEVFFMEGPVIGAPNKWPKMQWVNWPWKLGWFHLWSYISIYNW